MSKNPVRILILEDRSEDAELMIRELTKSNCDFTHKLVSSEETFLETIETYNPELMLVDYALPNYSGMTALTQAKQLLPEVPVIIVSGRVGEEVAIEAMKAGATDYILKQRLNRLGPVVLRTLHEAGERIYAEIKFRTIIEASPNGILLVDQEGRITLVNIQIEKIFNYKREELIGQAIEILVPTTSPNKHRGGQKGVFAEAPIESIDAHREEHVGLRKDGTEFPVEISLSSLTTEAGLLTFVSIVDITARKDAEKRIREFYYIVSHELRSPLASINGSLNLIERGRLGELSPMATQLIKSTRSDSERLIRLVNDILDIPKIELGKLELRYEDIDVFQIVEAAFDGIRGIADKAGVHLANTLNLAGKLHCDKDRIIQVLINLLSNAIRFSPEGGQVTVRLEYGTAGMARFSVTDAGPGIPKDQYHKLFVLFEQIDVPDSRAMRGTGLGLAISKGIVEQHQGSIGIDSIVGQGSTFWFELPCLNDDLTEKDAISPMQSGRAQG